MSQEKVINKEWMQELLAGSKSRGNAETNRPSIDWIQNKKAFSKELVFKLVNPNSKENNIFSWIVGTHWNLGINGDKRFICPESTMHLKNNNVRCPICEAKRKLLMSGFKEDELTTAGPYGPVSVFDPIITSNSKVIVKASDVRDDWDGAHISVLQQKGTILTTWLVEKYVDATTPNLLQWDSSNLIRFHRKSENSKWDRELSFATLNLDTDKVTKLKEENELLVMPELWPMPSDKELLEVSEIASAMISSFTDAKNTATKAASIDEDDKIPF